MRRTIYSLAGVLILAWAGTDSALALDCTTPDRVSVSVKVKDPKPKINQTKTLKYINTRANHGRLRASNGLTLGMTVSAYGSQAKLRFKVETLGNQACFNVSQVNATFGHQKLEILIPREFHPGTCQYNTVMRHEKEHARINREGVRKYAKILRKELEKAFSRFNPRRVKNPKTAQGDAQKTLNGVLRRVTKKFEQDINKKHAVIDKPGGPYDATGACRQWN